MIDSNAKLRSIQMPFCTVPEDEEWCWNDIVDALLKNTSSGGTAV